MIHSPQPLNELPDDLEMMLKMAEAKMGFRPNSLATMAKRPALMKGFMGLMMALAGEEFTLSEELRQMIAYMASYAAGCQYCQAHTAHGAEHAGVDAGKIENLWQYETSELFSAAEKAALAFAFAAGQTPNAVEDSHYAALNQHYSEEEILDMVGLISVFGFLNRWNDSLGTQLEDGPAQYAGAHLDGSNWKIGKHGGAKL